MHEPSGPKSLEIRFMLHLLHLHPIFKKNDCSAFQGTKETNAGPNKENACNLEYPDHRQIKDDFIFTPEDGAKKDLQLNYIYMHNKARW